MLNGFYPEPNRAFLQKNGSGLWVNFNRSALFGNDDYFIVRLQDGRRSIFPVRDLP